MPVYHVQLKASGLPLVSIPVEAASPAEAIAGAISAATRSDLGRRRLTDLVWVSVDGFRLLPWSAIALQVLQSAN